MTISQKLATGKTKRECFNKYRELKEARNKEKAEIAERGAKGLGKAKEEVVVVAKTATKEQVETSSSKPQAEEQEVKKQEPPKPKPEPKADQMLDPTLDPKPDAEFKKEDLPAPAPALAPTKVRANKPQRTSPVAASRSNKCGLTLHKTIPSSSRFARLRPCTASN